MSLFETIPCFPHPNLVIKNQKVTFLKRLLTLLYGRFGYF